MSVSTQNFSTHGPCTARLQVKLVIRFGDGVRRQKRFRSALAQERTGALGLDLAIDDHVCDMNAFRPELARHRLCERPQSKLGHREIGEACAAAQ